MSLCDSVVCVCACVHVCGACVCTRVTCVRILVCVCVLDVRVLRDMMYLNKLDIFFCTYTSSSEIVSILLQLPKFS